MKYFWTILYKGFYTKKLVFQLITMRNRKYRIEVEKYYLGSGDVTMLSFHFFQTFMDAQRFVKGYWKPYYRMSIHDQRGEIEALCNIETGAWATESDLKSIQYVQDKFFYKDVIGAHTNGWYYRGLNTHNPDFTEVTCHFESLIVEIRRRLSGNLTRKGIHQVVNQVFDEQHPFVSDYYRRSFEDLFVQAIKKSLEN